MKKICLYVYNWRFKALKHDPSPVFPPAKKFHRPGSRDIMRVCSRHTFQKFLGRWRPVSANCGRSYIGKWCIYTLGPTTPQKATGVLCSIWLTTVIAPLGGKVSWEMAGGVPWQELSLGEKSTALNSDRRYVRGNNHRSKDAVRNYVMTPGVWSCHW